TAEPQGVESEQRRDHQQPDHVDEAHGDQDDEALQIRAQDSADSLSERCHRLAPTPRTTPLNTMRITPNPAATPSSDTRRLDMISIAIGRLSGVMIKMVVTKAPSTASSTRPQHDTLICRRYSTL